MDTNDCRWAPTSLALLMASRCTWSRNWRKASIMHLSCILMCYRPCSKYWMKSKDKLTTHGFVSPWGKSSERPRVFSWLPPRRINRVVAQYLLKKTTSSSSSTNSRPVKYGKTKPRNRFCHWSTTCRSPSCCCTTTTTKFQELLTTVRYTASMGLPSRTTTTFKRVKLRWSMRILKKQRSTSKRLRSGPEDRRDLCSSI